MKASMGAVLLGVTALVPTGTAQGTLQVRADELVLADGSRLSDGVVVIADGKIRAVGRIELDDSLPLLEHHGVLSAGLIACQTHSGTAGGASDSTRSLLPEARLKHAIVHDHPDFEDALAAGITTVVVTPTEQNVAGGVTAVVKTKGGTLLAEEAHLHLAFSGGALGTTSAPSFFFGQTEEHEHEHEHELAASDGRPENTGSSRRGSRPPTSFAGAVRALEQHLAGARGVFARVASGELPVLMTAWDRSEVARAVAFAQAHGLKGAIRGAPLAGDPHLLPRIAESGLGVVLGPFLPGHRRRSLESVRKLHAAGVPVGFALDAPSTDPQAFRMTAALALQAGANPVQVLRSMTSDAARIAGVADRVGTLEPGKDADFVLWSGDPLDLTSRVEAVYVDGELAWRNDR